MSAHYSRYSLNTYWTTPYLEAQLPTGYPMGAVLQKCRAFRRLPPNLRKLSALAKQWAIRKNPGIPGGMNGIEEWYDARGYELNPETGRLLTDEEIDASWGPLDPGLKRFKVTDIPIPSGGFADPAAWEPNKKPEPEDEDKPNRKQIIKDTIARGPEAAARTYGLSPDQLPTFHEARMDFHKRAAKVLESFYFAKHEDEYVILSTALMDGVDLYDDLVSPAREIYDRAEAALT